MAAAKTVKRQMKEETVEVWQQDYFSWRVLALIYTITCSLNFKCERNVALMIYFIRANCAILWLQQHMATLASFSLLHFVVCFTHLLSRQAFLWVSWKTDKNPSCLSRGWWLWQFPPSLTSEGFSQRVPTDPDIWKVKNEPSVSWGWPVTFTCSLNILCFKFL